MHAAVGTGEILGRVVCEHTQAPGGRGLRIDFCTMKGSLRAQHELQCDFVTAKREESALSVVFLQRHSPVTQL